MKKLISLLVLLPLVASASGSNHHNDDVTVTVGEVRTNVETDVQTGDVNVATGSVTTGDVKLDAKNNVNFEASASSAYAYAAQCGTAGGVSVKEFSASVSGESQYCKHLRISSFYEGLYKDALRGNDNVMAQVWYNAMVVEIRTAQTLIDSTAFTGAAKETAGDLLLPTMLCGGLAAAATPFAGYACIAIIGIKAGVDGQKVKERTKTTRDALEIRSTEHIEECPKGTCSYVDGVLEYTED